MSEPFTNEQRAPASLPEASTVTLHPIERSYWWATSISTFVVLTALAVAARVGIALLGSEFPYGVWVAGWSVIAACVVLIPLYTFAHARSIHYAIREHDLHRAAGVFFKTHLVQPLARVQHVEITQGPIEKQLDLATLTVFSAGQGSATFNLPGLKQAFASALREQLLSYRR